MKKTLMGAILLLLFTFNILYANEKDEQIKNAIVKIYTIYKSPDYLEPWNVSIRRANGSGVIIDNNLILTNAHVVANTTFIEVKHFGKTKRYKAKVKAVSHQADLALLSVEEREFFKGITPLQIGELPYMQQKVSIYGFPAGGTTLSISEGIVSRIEHFRYKHSGESFLGIQVDAAINSGNSGGPAISNGKIVGIVMQNMPKAQNIGYLVPTPIINHFLEDIKDGVNDGFSALGLVTENLENPALRSFYGLDENQSGQLITYITYNEQEHGFRVGDIITAIDGHKIENDGSVNFRINEFTDFKYYVDLHQMGEKIIFDVVRKGEKIKIPMVLKHKINDLLLVKILQYDTMPTYYIFGGYLFSPLTRNLLSQSSNTPMRLKKFTRIWPSKSNKEVVVMIKVLADKTNRGNHTVTYWPVETLNGKKIGSFREFYKMIESNKKEYIVLEDEDGYQIIIDTKISKANEEALLKRYNIPINHSEDLNY